MNRRCQKKGHNLKTERVIIRQDGQFRAICEDSSADIMRCQRCGYIKGEPVNLEYITGYQKVSMPSSMWDEIRENGYLIV